METPYNTDRDRNRGEVARAAGLLLIVLGVAVGVLIAVISRQRSQFRDVRSDNQELGRALAMIESRHGELVSFLSRPGTELLKLTGQRQWQGQALNVAWNPVQRKAVILIDKLPAPANGMLYRFRAVTADGTVVPIGTLDPSSPSSHVYTVSPEVAGPDRFEISIDPADGDKSGDVVFAPMHT